eukprot:Nk52_evm15s2192 gene=Nk52_evmTU15s2192
MNRKGVLVCVVTVLILALGVTLADEVAELDPETEVSKIAFGSCNKQYLPQPVWPAIQDYAPDLFMWTGDIIYADKRIAPTVWIPRSPEEMKREWKLQEENANYTEFAKHVPIIGVWDDHDFGKNDGGSDFVDKGYSKQYALDFLKEPKDSPRRHREGVYTDYMLGKGQHRVHIIMLDLRYFFDREKGDLLGDVQWLWLEKEALAKEAGITLIVSGIQVFSVHPIAENWSYFSTNIKRLTDIIERTKKNGIIFVSGDVHFAEFSCCREEECKKVPYPLFEITSSGLTHDCVDDFGQACKYTLEHTFSARNRVGSVFTEKNWGSIEIEWGDTTSDTVKGTTKIKLQVHNTHTVSQA